MAMYARVLTALAFCVLSLATTARAQPANETPRFLALDLSGGVLPVIQGREDEETDAWDLKGWSLDGTVRFLPWLGAVGSFARTSDFELPASHLSAGMRASTKFAYGGNWLASRLFAHALVGYVTPRGGPEAPDGGAELVLGGGLDVFAFLRLQLDYIGSSVDDVDSYRAFVGGVVPLCFSRCREDDGLIVGGRDDRP